MRRIVVAVAPAGVLTGPFVLAFFSGGYFDEARLWATVVTWTLVIASAVGSEHPLPASREARLALVGLILLAGWTAASFAWAPLAGVVQTDLTRIALYLGALLAAAAMLRGEPAWRAIEPALCAGTAIVIGYGIAERLLPGILHYSRSVSAGGRLEQPLTYWNAEGVLAAIGLVLCARLVGDHARGAVTRSVAAAATVVLGAGIYLSFSRGAIAAAIAGLVVLVAAAPTREQLRATVLAGIAAVLGAAAVGPFPGVASLHGSLAARERDGVMVLALVAVLGIAAGAIVEWLGRSERAGRRRSGSFSAAHRAPAMAAGVVVAVIVVGLVIGALGEHRDPTGFGANAGRLTTVGSYRANYWEVALRSFAHHPLDGLGSGGFRVAWLRERTIPIATLDAHSLELQTAAELGLPGLAALALLLVGVALGARRAYRRRPALVAGWGAALVVWLLHSAIDWDWQMPAVTLVAVLLGGAMLAVAEEPLGASLTVAEVSPVAHDP